MIKLIIPLYKILLNPKYNYKVETKEKMHLIKKLIEDILQISKIEYFLDTETFEFDKKVNSLVLSIVENKFDKIKPKIEAAYSNPNSKSIKYLEDK
jgi:hypothetical protein